MHLIWIRRSICKQHPRLAMDLLKAVFMESKKSTIVCRKLGQVGHYFPACRWYRRAFRKTIGLMGSDFWPYGIKPIALLLDQVWIIIIKQGLSKRQVAVDELFAPSAAYLSKI